MPKLKRVLAATDGTNHGNRAVVTGVGLANRAGADVDIVTVVSETMPPIVTPVSGWAPGWSPESLTALEQINRQSAERQAREAGAADAPVHVRRGRPASLISETAREVDADVIVLGAHHQAAVERFLLGSTAEKVTRMADSPILVATEEHARAFQRVLVALDVSPQSRTVLESAATIAAAEGADIRALYVQEPLSEAVVSVMSTALGELESKLANMQESARLEFEKLVTDFADSSSISISIDDRVRRGRAGPEILKEVEEWDSDLVVLGTHGHGFVHRLMIGSTSLHVLRHIDRATLLVPSVETE
ncbi:MAG: universal stress protein [Gemmatimonadales bacterium]|jgi:nucleotide-binding universal stress UspA family protein